MEDERIIELYWDRDQTAISETEAKYGKYCLKIAFNILSLREDAEECVSDTWLSAWNSMPPKRPSKLMAFLGRITRNGALDRFRTLSRQKRGGGAAALALDELSECVPASKTVEKELEDREIASIISQWLRSLSEEKRKVFLRRYWYFDSVEQISNIFGFSQSKTTSMLHRLREELRKTLEKEGIVI